MGIQAKQNDMYWNTNVCFTSGQNINLYIPKNITNPTNEIEDKKIFFNLYNHKTLQTYLNQDSKFDLQTL